MRILVYGAGVLGSYLAHVLVRGGNEVTMLARGKRAEQLKTNGLVIRHYFQLRTTVDEVNVIQELVADDLYDLIFVVMKYNDFPSVLSTLAENSSDNIVLVGNNADARGMQYELQAKSKTKKNVLFGFQVSAGHREESGRIISIRGGGQMLLGSLDGEISIKPILEKAFKRAKYKLIYHEDIDAWLKSHIVPIVAMTSVGFLYDGDLPKASKDKKLLKQAIAAMDEGFQLLEKLNYKVTPASQVNLIRKHRGVAYQGLKLIHKLPFMKWVDGSFGEISALYDSFEKLKNQAHAATPHWDDLEKRTKAKFLRR
ncbi:ketopantoate reductase family protein [Cohnella thailandensis]|uniref:Ketopantoate reductase family protein n=1 Tax=Cohnella thailandensis TaxID=557557 RepID=A0A841SVA4_9BACL|nr:ketopantoate reductase family protein [Cohnella thailandensis]MBB6634526.1 ketopantoate reductase family protein [Cohnella thailandensis]MBP1972920.1 2-dehydropantoate 2-reductase [Cohnella thailandensis]